MTIPAGIPSFRAMCPPSPGRGDSPAIWQPDILEDSIGPGIQDLGGIQGVRVPFQPCTSRMLLVTPAQISNTSQLGMQSPLLSRSQPTLPELALPELAEAPPELDDVTIRLRSCQILLPSNGTDNDAIRIRCSGRKLNGPLMPLISRMREVNPVDPQLRHSLSEASFPSASSRRFASGLAHVEPLNMRAQTWSGRCTTAPRIEPQKQAITRCVVRKASTLLLKYPGLEPLSRSPTPPRETASRAELLQKYTFKSSSPTTSASTKMRHVGSTRNEDDLAKMAAKKSSHMRDALFNLRRIGKDEPDDPPPPSPSIPASKNKKKSVAVPPDKKTGVDDAPLQQLAEPTTSTAAVQERKENTTAETKQNPPSEENTTAETALSPEQQAKVEKETSMMVATLNGVKDDCRDLREQTRLLAELQDPVIAAGGARHPTAVIAYRNLAVVRRKAELLEAVEVRLAALEAKCSQKEELFKQVTNNASPALEDMSGVRQFVAQFTHKPEENPADADKSSFDIFVSTFGIHKKHQHFERMMELANTTALWWAAQTLELAQNGAESEEIKRHMDVVNSIGADKAVLAQADETMKACTEILGARLAEQCLRTAKKLQEKDKLTVERSKDAQPQSAKDCAAAVNDDMRRAVALGATQKHPAMQEAKQIAMALELEEKVRYGLEALLAAQKIQKQDNDAAMVYEKKEGMPPVGPASEAADMVDKKIKEAIKKGAPESHEHIKNANAISKELRDTDGIRKRTANRAKRTAT